MNEYIKDQSRALCILCTKEFEKNEMICMEGRWICAECKPAFLQMVQEGASMADFTIARRKKALVMGKKASLPDRCVKCNAPANGQRLKRNLYWHTPAIYLLIFVSILIYAITAICIRKKAAIQVGLCDTHRSRRKINIVVSWAAFLISIVMIVAGVASTNLAELSILGVLLMLGSIIYASLTVSIVRAQKIDKEYVWVSGAGKDYLDSLPDWVQPGK